MPPSSLRQAPWPLQSSTARAMPPSAAKLRWVGGSWLTVAGLRRRLSAKGGTSTTLPGLSRPWGSKAALSLRKAWTRRGPNMRSMKTPRRMPSPCSPLRLPSNSITRSAMRSASRSMEASSVALLMLAWGRTWRQPTLAWP